MGRRARSTTTTRPATRSPSPSAGPCSTRATPAARSSSTRAGRADPASSSPAYLIDLLPAGPPRRVLPGRLGPAGRRPVAAGRRLRHCRRLRHPRRPGCIDRTGTLAGPGRRGRLRAGPRVRPRRARRRASRLPRLQLRHGARRGVRDGPPDRVGRFVLDGAFDPTAGDPDRPARLRRHARLRRRRDGRRDRPLPRAVRRLRGVCRRSGQPGAWSTSSR